MAGAVRQKTGQKIVSHLRPGSFVITTGGGRYEAGFVAEPAMTKSVELSRTEGQPLCGRKAIQLAGMKGGGPENFSQGNPG